MANKILGFGTSATNELTDAAYAADAQRLSGNVPGVARSALVNKAMHQMSLIAAGVAQFITDRQNADVVDTLTPQQIADMLSSILGGSLVGNCRNLRCSGLPTSTASLTFTADQITVTSALSSGKSVNLASFSKTINTGTVGAGGMDIGTAPLNGYIAIYAIYNPTTGVSALLGINATSVAQPEVYGGANMPAGYTMSALISIWGTGAGGLFRLGFQWQREVFFGFIGTLNAGTATTYTSFSLAAAVPLGAKKWGGSLFSAPTNANNGTYLTADAVGNSGNQSINSPVANQGVTAPVSLPIITPQTAYYQNNGGGGTASATVNRYEF